MLPAGIVYTSGTTSRPKAVVHTHANALWAARMGPVNIDMTGDDTYLVYLPFFHVNAVPLLLTGEGKWWSQGYFAEVARRVEQIAVMSYDTALPLEQP